MRREEWEQDLRDRQRNIVFSDTVRNQTNFYRRLLRGNRPLTTAHRVGLGVLAVFAFSVGCFGLASLVADFRDRLDEFSTWLTLIIGGLVSSAYCFFALLMLRRALWPNRSSGPSGGRKNQPWLGKIRRRPRVP